MPRKGPHKYGAYEKAHIADTAERVEARRFMEKKVGKLALIGHDVDHKLSIKGGGTNAPTNLRLRLPGPNRGDKTFGP